MARRGAATRRLPAKAGIAEDAERLRRALKSQQRVSEALREVGVALGTTLDLDDLLELILGRITELLEADRSTLYLVEDATGDLVSRVVIGSEVRSIRVKVGHGIAGAVAKIGKPITVPDAYGDPRFEPEWDKLTGYRTTCMLAAPLKNHLGRTIGVVQVLNKKHCTFTEDDEALLTSLSTQAAVAIDNSRLFLSLVQKNRQLLDTKDQLERKVRDLEVLFELERATARARSLEDLISASLAIAIRACDARGAALLLSDQESGDLTEYTFCPDKAVQLVRSGVRSGVGVWSKVTESKNPINFGRLNPDDPTYRHHIGHYSFDLTSLIAQRLEGAQGVMGAIALFSCKRKPTFDAEDQALLFLVAANVSTALRLFIASEERERSARLTSIGRLLSQVIHDFKSPLAVISGYIQLMQGADDPEVRGDHARKALKQFDVLSSMEREVLEFARGEKKIFVRKVYLHKFFGDLSQQLAMGIDGRAIDVEMDIDTKIVARFDESRVARAIQNLARNAVEAMSKEGGRLSIEAKMDGKDLMVAVSDTGPGIPDEIRDRIFQSFVTSGKEHGTGLGLAIVKKIVDEHGGSIRLGETKRGARFEILLPQQAEPSVAKSTRARKNSRVKKSKSRSASQGTRS